MASGQAISIELPHELYERIRQIAAHSERSVESVLIESLKVLFGEPLEETALAALDDYTDAQLWAVIYQRLAWPENERLRDLTARGKGGELTPDERDELDALLDRVDRHTLLRSRALLLLKQRGRELKRL
jgi:predicted transcriptional regulator